MRTKGRVRCCLIALFLVSLFVRVSAQEGRKEQTIVPMKGGYFVAFSTLPGAASGGVNGWSMTFAEAYFESNTIRRVFIDSDGLLYFGYSLVVEPLASSKQFRVSVRPLSPEDEQELRARKSFQSRRIHPNYNSGGLSRSTVPQTIADGDTFALDVLVNPKTGERITDFVTVTAIESRLRETSTSDSKPRDFTLEDVAMKMINYQLFIDGALVAGGKRSGAAAGPIIWFHLEGRGRFIFSLMPHEGYDFQKIGTIEHSKISFTLKGEHYEWISDVPVVDTAGPWNLYVLHDPKYVPDSFFLGVNGAAKGANSPTPSRLNEIETALRLPKRTAPTAFGKPSRKEDTPDKAPGARLIIGAAGRVENLLPVGTRPFVQPAVDDVYEKWLYEDAAYIITPEETWAFKRLETDEEREQFVEQFWRRRDPDPTTTQNEFRTEHYARIAYANESFSFGNLPGWRSDRGRVYIIYGKPDELETLPRGERWRYKAVPGLRTEMQLEFVDPNGKGEFRLSRQPDKP